MKSKQSAGQQNDGEFWHKPFTITSVCRADVRKFYGDEEIERLTDKDMAYIARKMAERSLDEEIFWMDLEAIVDDVMGWM